MAQKEVFITQQGLSKLEAELEYLSSVQRHEVAEKIKRAREMGSTENNAEYDDAKNDQSFIEGRILMLESILKGAVVIKKAPSPSGIVELGSNVLLHNQDGKIEQFVIVGSAEANPVEGRISNESPVGKALLGKKASDEVEVPIPAGVLKLSIVEVS